MTSALVIDCLGKTYQIGGVRLGDADVIRTAVAAVKRLIGSRLVKRPPPFWALRDVSLAVGRGEVVGLIGRNGAGKSTLLKVLSRVTPPTSGRARVWGRVAAALDASTDFNPELTGRENIFVRGAAMGMTRPEIRKRFDELVDFSGLKSFLDTPMKRYSHGMLMRMAFAIPAHLRSEILLVDEVLSLGDAPFRESAVAKMRQVARDEGRAVLFVSHDMAAIQQLCPRAVWLRDGQVAADGPVNDVADDYLASFSDPPDPGATPVAGGADGRASARVAAAHAAFRSRFTHPTAETIAATDLARRLAGLLDRTALGEAFEITRDGRPVARLVPAG